MKERLLKYWESLRSSFGFLPAIMVAAAMVLAYSTIALDRLVERLVWLPDSSWAYSGGAEGASLVLGTFVATFMYCLLILHSIRRGEGFVFVPQLLVSFGVLLVIGCSPNEWVGRRRTPPASRRPASSTQPSMAGRGRSVTRSQPTGA